MSREIGFLDRFGRPVRSSGAMILGGSMALWQGLPFELRSLPESSESGPCYNPHALASYCLQGTGVTTLISGRKTTKMPVQRGAFAIMERGYEMDHISWSGSGTTTILIDLRPDVLRVLMPEEGSSVELNTRLPAVDDRLEALALLMLGEIQGGCGSGRLFAQGLSIAFVECLRSRFGVPGQTRRPPGRLSKRDLDRVLDQIMDCLSEDLGVDQLAAVVGMSAAHFSRVFRATTGCSPYRFVQDQRIRHALGMLDGPQSLAEIAQSVGFASQSHFTQVFRQLLGTTPARVRAESGAAAKSSR